MSKSNSHRRGGPPNDGSTGTNTRTLCAICFKRRGCKYGIPCPKTAKRSASTKAATRSMCPMCRWLVISTPPITRCDRPWLRTQNNQHQTSGAITPAISTVTLAPCSSAFSTPLPNAPLSPCWAFKDNPTSVPARRPLRAPTPNRESLKAWELWPALTNRSSSTSSERRSRAVTSFASTPIRSGSAQARATIGSSQTSTISHAATATNQLPSRRKYLRACCAPWTISMRPRTRPCMNSTSGYWQAR